MARVEVDDGKLVVLMGTLERIQTAMAKFEAPLQNVTDVDTSRAQTSFVGSFVSGFGFGMGAGVKMPFLPFGGRYSTESGSS